MWPTAWYAVLSKDVSEANNSISAVYYWGGEASLFGRNGEPNVVLGPLGFFGSGTSDRRTPGLREPVLLNLDLTGLRERPK